MDIKFQLKVEMKWPEMKALTDIDYMHDIMPLKNQFNTHILNWRPNIRDMIIKMVQVCIQMPNERSVDIVFIMANWQKSDIFIFQLLIELNVTHQQWL